MPLFACSNGNDDFNPSSSSATDPSSSSAKQIFDERDGKKYAYVEIGNQNWMAENLNYGGGDGSIGRCYKDDDDNCNTLHSTWVQELLLVNFKALLPVVFMFDVLFNGD